MIADNEHMQAYLSVLKQQESEMREAMRAVHDRLWTVEEMKQRCSLVRFSGDPIGKELFCIDGKEMVQFYPVESKLEDRGDSYVLTASRKYQRLYSTPSSPSEKQE